MNRWERKQTGFTIVELLIVVVVIAILAAITIVAYNGIRQRATESSVQTALSQANKKILAYAALNGDVYPDSLADAGVTASKSAIFQYSSDNSGATKTYAITASDSPAGSYVYYMSSTQPVATAGIAPGHNLIVWDKTKTDSVPVDIASGGVFVDTAVFRNSISSIRLIPGATGKQLRGTPVTGAAGQSVTVSFWMLSDSSWNGTAGNSKIRFANVSDGSLLSVCGYAGVKTTWTFVTCSRTLTSTYPSVNVSVGNDASSGNIWLDDISLSVK